MYKILYVIHRTVIFDTTDTAIIGLVEQPAERVICVPWKQQGHKLKEHLKIYICRDPEKHFVTILHCICWYFCMFRVTF